VMDFVIIFKLKLTKQVHIMEIHVSRGKKSNHGVNNQQKKRLVWYLNAKVSSTCTKRVIRNTTGRMRTLC